jgi:hypothetical protein
MIIFAVLALYNSTYVQQNSGGIKHTYGGASVDSLRYNTLNSAVRAKSTDWLVIRLCFQYAVVTLAFNGPGSTVVYKTGRVGLKIQKGSSGPGPVQNTCCAGPQKSAQWHHYSRFNRSGVESNL